MASGRIKQEEVEMMAMKAEDSRCAAIAEMLMPKIKELMPDEKSTFKIAFKMAEAMDFGNMRELRISHSLQDCCEVVEFKVDTKIHHSF